MQAAKLNQRIQILQRAAGSDALGQPTTTWEVLVTVWADVRFVSGIETIKAGREVSTSRASVQVRFVSGLSVDMRASIGGVEYAIADVIPDRKRAYQTLICEAVR